MHRLLVEMIVGGVSLEIVDDLRTAAAGAADYSLHSLLTDAVTSAVDSLQSVCDHCCHIVIITCL